MELLFGHIRIESYAGGGSFGDVYRGYDERMERDVAIKIVSRVDKSERKLLRQLDHKGLPRLYDAVDKGDKTYLIMEWIEGINLDAYISQNGMIQENIAVKIGKELLEILEYLHSQKPEVIYQDLKPGNIMLMPNGHVKLVDFGTAFLMDFGDGNKRLAGTVGYSAPEQKGLCGERRATVRSDIYSWGAVMYSLLSGRLLNKPPYTMEKIRKVSPHLSFGLARVIAKATMREENRRYKNIREVRKGLEDSICLDFVYNTAFLGAIALSVIPLIVFWIKAVGENFFGNWLSTFETVFVSKSLKSFVAISERTLTMSGILIVCLCWMILSLRLLHNKKYIKINKSIYLSEKRYPGLWIGALFAGIIVGYGLWGEENTIISYAAGEVLPLSVYDNNGNHVLVNYNSAYKPDGELKLCISEEVLGTIDNPEITVILTDKSSGKEKRRTMNIDY